MSAGNSTISGEEERRPSIGYGVIALALSTATLIGLLIAVVILIWRRCQKTKAAGDMWPRRRRHPAGCVKKPVRTKPQGMGWCERWVRQRDATEASEEAAQGPIEGGIIGGCARASLNRLENTVRLQPLYIDGRDGNDSELWEWRHQQLHSQQQRRRSVQVPLSTQAMDDRDKQPKRVSFDLASNTASWSETTSSHIYEEIDDEAMLQTTGEMRDLAVSTSEENEERAISAPGRIASGPGREGPAWHYQLYGRSDSNPVTADEKQIHKTVIRVTTQALKYGKPESKREEDLLARKRMQKNGVRPWRPNDDRQVKVTLV